MILTTTSGFQTTGFKPIYQNTWSQKTITRAKIHATEKIMDKKKSSPYQRIRITANVLVQETYTERYVYSFVEVVASIGGCLGLFTGCSLLSVVEVFIVALLSILSIVMRGCRSCLTARNHNFNEHVNPNGHAVDGGSKMVCLESLN